MIRVEKSSFQFRARFVLNIPIFLGFLFCPIAADTCADDSIRSATEQTVPTGDLEKNASRATLALGLGDAIQLGLEHSDVVRKLTGSDISVDPTTWYESRSAQELVRAALAQFDPTFDSEIGYRWLRNPPESFFGPGLQQEDRRDVGILNAGISKRWQSGTITRAGYRPDPAYLYFPNGSTGFNPFHVSAAEFSVRQALLQGSSSAVNCAPVRIAQINGEQSAWEFKLAMIQFVRSVEQAYWELQSATAAREALEQQRSAFDEVVRIEEAALRAERSAVAEVAKARSRRHEFRQLLLAAANKETSRERALRTLIGLPLDDDSVLQLQSVPSEAPVVIDLPAAIETAMNEQPRVVQRRLEVQIRETELLVAQDAYRPKLDVLALYRANGLNDQLGRSLEQMLTNDFHDWEVGATFSVPLQRGGAVARINAAELQLQRDRAVLREQARVVAHDLTNAVNDIQSLFQQYQEARARVEESNKWLEIARIRHKTPPPNRDADDNRLLVALDDYLDALREVADATDEAASILADYNTAQARLEESQGTLLERRDIILTDDPCHTQPVQELLRKSDSEPLKTTSQEVIESAPQKSAAPPADSPVPKSQLPNVRPRSTMQRSPLPASTRPVPAIQPSTSSPAQHAEALNRYPLRDRIPAYEQKSILKLPESVNSSPAGLSTLRMPTAPPPTVSSSGSSVPAISSPARSVSNAPLPMSALSPPKR